jgi:hypothetical protein
VKKRSDAAAATKAVIIKLGATYRDRDGILVVAEEFEVGKQGRTGRVIVCGVDGVLRFPRRWFCRARDLIEVPEQAMLPLGPAGEGGPHP